LLSSHILYNWPYARASSCACHSVPHWHQSIWISEALERHTQSTPAHTTSSNGGNANAFASNSSASRGTHTNQNENPSPAILLAANGPAEANLNVPRKFQPRNTTNHRFRTSTAPIGTNTCTTSNRGMFRGNEHPFTHSTIDNNVTGHGRRKKLLNNNSTQSHQVQVSRQLRILPPNCHDLLRHQRPRTAQFNQRIPLRKAKQQTNIPPRNERTTASLTSAKRSVVTSDAARTHSPSPEIHSEFLADADELSEHNTNRQDHTTANTKDYSTNPQILQTRSDFRSSVAKSAPSQAIQLQCHLPC